MVNFNADPSNTSEFGEIVEISSKLGHSWRHFDRDARMASIIITTKRPMATYGGDTVTLNLPRMSSPRLERKYNWKLSLSLKTTSLNPTFMHH